MVTPEAAENIILTALNTINAEFAVESKIQVGPNTALFGVDAAIDSLSLVSLIVDIEAALNSDYNLSLSLTDDRAMTRTTSPFTDVQSLKTYIIELVSETA